MFASTWSTCTIKQDAVICAVYVLLCRSTLAFVGQEEDEGWKMQPSNFVPTVHEATDTYKSENAE